MGMMTRRNVKSRAVEQTASVFTENKKEDFSKNMNPPEVGVSYTKTEINRKSTADLKELAMREGIEGAEDMNGADLKKVLIEKFGL